MKNNKNTNTSTKKTNVNNNNASRTPKNKKIVKKKIVKNNLLEDKNYKLAEKLYKNSEYEKAYNEYLKLNEIYLKNKKIYKRLIETLTHNYTYKEKSKEFKKCLDDYITTYKILCTKKELKIFENKLTNYKSIKAIGNKSRFLLISTLGFFGIHKFIEKKYIAGIIYLFTLGIFGLGVLYDLINDYAEYEDDKQLDILRYLISIIILIFALFRINTTNFYYFIIVSIIFMPIVFSKILRLIPGFIKFIAIIILCYLGFRIEPVVYYVPASFNGTWVTNNENTNYESIKISKEKSIIKFTDREPVKGTNEYDNTNKVLKIYVNATTSYKFRIDTEKEEICTYNDYKTCIISFKKETNKK